MSRHGRATMPFGKYRGVQVRLIPDSYLSWLSEKFAENSQCAVEEGSHEGLNLNNPKWEWLRQSVLSELKHRGFNVDPLVEDHLSENFAVTEPGKPSDWTFPIHDAAHVLLAIKNFHHIPRHAQTAAAAKIIAAAKKFGFAEFKLGDLEVHEQQRTFSKEVWIGRDCTPQSMSYKFKDVTSAGFGRIDEIEKALHDAFKSGLFPKEIVLHPTDFAKASESARNNFALCVTGIGPFLYEHGPSAVISGYRNLFDMQRVGRTGNDASLERAIAIFA